MFGLVVENFQQQAQSVEIRLDHGLGQIEGPGAPVEQTETGQIAFKIETEDARGAAEVPSVTLDAVAADVAVKGLRRVA